MRRNAYYRMLGIELRRTLHDRMTWIGVLGFTVILGVGAWLYWNALPPRPANGRLFGESYLLATMIAWHAGFARDRASKFDMYLAANFVHPAALFFAKVSAALAIVGGFSAIAFAFAVASSAGDIRYAAHYTLVFSFAAVLALPAIVLIELVLNTRNPVPILIILFFTSLALYSRFGDARAFIGTLGLDGSTQIPGTAARCAIALALTAALYPLFKLRMGGPRLAAIVNSS
jgi:hypothetical protein